MPRPKREGGPAYEPSVQFRPIPALTQLVKPFAERQGLALNEAYKDLAALAIVGLDVRYFELVNQMALAMGGTNAFVQACLRIHAALNGAALAGRPLMSEPDRSLFVLKVVKEFVESNARQLPALDLWFLREEPPAGEPAEARQKASTTRRRRTIRSGSMGEDVEGDETVEQ